MSAQARKTQTESGEIVGGRYRRGPMLGRGGFAEVFLAQHVEIPSLYYAVKILRNDAMANPTAVKRFMREATTVARLRSRHTVKVQDYGQTPRGEPFIVMEFVDGLPLNALLRQEKRLSNADVGRLTLDILRSLAEAHEQGIVHRDLKPANIFVVDDPDSNHPMARVLDFGIAKLIDGEDADLTVLTMTGELACTPRYASPEQLKGNAGPATDIYALGHVMGAMIEGKPPYSGISSFEVIAEQLKLSEPVPLGPRIQQSPYAAIIAKALEKRLEDRYTTAQEMMADVANALSRIPESEQHARTLGPLRSKIDAELAFDDAQTVAGDSIESLALRPEPTGDAVARRDEELKTTVFNSAGYSAVSEPEEAPTVLTDRRPSSPLVAPPPPAPAATTPSRIPLVLGILAGAALIAGAIIYAGSDRNEPDDQAQEFEETIDGPSETASEEAPEGIATEALGEAVAIAVSVVRDTVSTMPGLYRVEPNGSELTLVGPADTERLFSGAPSWLMGDPDQGQPVSFLLDGASAELPATGPWPRIATSSTLIEVPVGAAPEPERTNLEPTPPSREPTPSRTERSGDNTSGSSRPGGLSIRP